MDLIKGIVLAVAKANYQFEEANEIAEGIAKDLRLIVPVTTSWDEAKKSLGCDKFAVKEEVFRGYVVTKSNAVHEVRVLRLMKFGDLKVVYKLSVSGVAL